MVLMRGGVSEHCYSVLGGESSVQAIDKRHQSSRKSRILKEPCKRGGLKRAKSSRR